MQVPAASQAYVMNEVFVHLLAPHEVPAGTVWQVPWRPGSAHDEQLGQALVAQQMPSTQKPLEHSTPVRQVSPFPLTMRHAPD